MIVARNKKYPSLFNYNEGWNVHCEHPLRKWDFAFATSPLVPTPLAQQNVVYSPSCSQTPPQPNPSSRVHLRLHTRPGFARTRSKQEHLKQLVKSHRQLTGMTLGTAGPGQRVEEGV